MSNFDLRQYLKVQAQETCRAFVIHAPAMAGKTRLARSMEKIFEAYLFDFQEYSKSKEELYSNIDRFRPRDFENLLLGLKVPQNIIVVDNIDFLMIVWTPKMKRVFMEMIDLRLKSPDVTSKIFIFFVQDDSSITEYRFTHSQRQQRILPLTAIKALV